MLTITYDADAPLTLVLSCSGRSRHARKEVAHVVGGNVGLVNGRRMGHQPSGMLRIE